MDFGKDEQIKIFRTTVKDVISNLSKLKDIHYTLFFKEVEIAFAGYEYEDQDEVIGYQQWTDISKDGNYQVCAKVNHEDAYTFTIYILVKNEKVTVTNIL